MTLPLYDSMIVMESNSELTSEIQRRVRELQNGLFIESNSRWIFQHFYPRILGFLKKRGFHEEREDLAQEIFFQVFRQIQSFRAQSKFESWLFAIAANACRNEYRRRGREKRTGDEVQLDGVAVGSSLLLGMASTDASPELSAFQKQRLSALDQEIQSLPLRMRQCFVLRHYRNLKYREIAILLNVSLDTVKAHLFQARHRLRNQLGQAFEDWGP